MPLAHTGHWIVQALYFLPVVAFLVWLAVIRIRDRRARGRDPSEDKRQASKRE